MAQSMWHRPGQSEYEMMKLIQIKFPVTGSKIDEISKNSANYVGVTGMWYSLCSFELEPRKTGA